MLNIRVEHLREPPPEPEAVSGSISFPVLGEDIPPLFGPVMKESACVYLTNVTYFYRGHEYYDEYQIS